MIHPRTNLEYERDMLHVVQIKNESMDKEIQVK